MKNIILVKIMLFGGIKLHLIMSKKKKSILVKKMPFVPEDMHNKFSQHWLIEDLNGTLSEKIHKIN